MLNYTEYKTCRLCAGHDIKTILDFGKSPLANAFLRKEDFAKECEVPLSVFTCHSCGAVQLHHTVDPVDLFSQYLYTSSTSNVFKQHFKQYAQDLWKELNLAKNDLVLDIGSNDGILLKPLKELGCRVIGVDPALSIAQKASDEGIYTYKQFFTEDLAKDIKAEGKHYPCRVITANNVFAHIDDLHDVIKGIKTLLLDDGIFVFETAYWLNTIDNMYLDQIYHEHIFYHYIKPLTALFRMHQMEIFDVQYNKIQGGTIRVFVQRKDGKQTVKNSVKHAIERETGFNFPSFYAVLPEYIAKLDKTLHEKIQAYKSVCAYGAPAKFTTFCKLMNITNKDIAFVVDDAPLKQGLYTPGTHIPVVPNSWLYDKNTEACVITAWNFADAIIETNKNYKGKWIVPLPQVKEITV